MTSPTPRERITITIEDAGGRVPMCARLRRLLKSLLRQHGLRCVSCLPAAAGSRLTESNPENPNPGSER
jgi:hypothetical protein